MLVTERHMSTDRKSTRLNSSHLGIAYAVFCLKRNILVDPCFSGASRLVRVSRTSVAGAGGAPDTPAVLERRPSRGLRTRSWLFLFFFYCGRPPRLSSPSPHPAPLAA